MRSVLVVVILLTAATALALQRPKVAIGIVTAQQAPCDVGSHHLVEGAKQNPWMEPHHELGFLHLKAPDADLKALEGKVVMAIGRVDPAFAPQSAGKACVEVEGEYVRPDALPGKDGPRIMNDRMGPLAHVGGFIAEQVAPISPLHAERDGKQVKIRFTSPVERRLRYITLSAHYEPCSGKGARKLRTRAFQPVEARGVVEASFPALLGKDPYALRSVWVTTDDREVLFDLDWPLPAGVVECPG